MARNSTKAPSIRPITAPPRALTRCSPGSCSTKSIARISSFSRIVSPTKETRNSAA